MDVIYDFETLSTDTFTGAVVCMAVLQFDSDRFLKDFYSYDELLDRARFIKFDVEEQVRKYGRKIEPATLGWWERQSPEAKELLKPSKQDISISKLYEILYEEEQIQKCKWQYARGPTFDCGFLKSILRSCGKDCPHNLYNARDTRSLIAGLTWGSDIKNGFVPEELKNKFIAHDPIHDVAMDVFRIQYLVRILNAPDYDDDIPF